jgi:hypothetical protein
MRRDQEDGQGWVMADYGSGGLGFESLAARTKPQVSGARGVLPRPPSWRAASSWTPVGPSAAFAAVNAHSVNSPDSGSAATWAL